MHDYYNKYNFKKDIKRFQITKSNKRVDSEILLNPLNNSMIK